MRMRAGAAPSPLLFLLLLLAAAAADSGQEVDATRAKQLQDLFEPKQPAYVQGPTVLSVTTQPGNTSCAEACVKVPGCTSYAFCWQPFG